ncbi:MAG: DEAD/DEAH box helicase, partial [Candidatus Bipolaricaulota bacterium]
MLQGDGASTDTLRRILRLEAARGFTDDAVLGGLESFVKTHADALHPIVAGYGSADHFARQRIVERLHEALDAPSTTDVEGSLIGPPVEQAHDPAELLRPVSDAVGVGAKRVTALAHLGILTIEDLLTHLPRRLEDRTEFKTIGALRPGDQVCVRATVLAISRFRVNRRMEAVKAALEDRSGILYGVWFNQPWIAKQLKKGLPIVVYGKVERNFGELQISSPVWEADGENVETGRWIPIYPGTEGAGDRYLRTTIRRNLERYLPHVTSILPDEAIAAHGLVPRRTALQALHEPPEPEAFEQARRSLAFEELYLLQIGLGRTNRRREGASHGGAGELPTSFLAALPFRLTAGQRVALREIVDELSSPRRMMRLLQGDVGSGKTVVALLTALHAIEGGHQVAFMVPTEILAEQHAAQFTELLEGLPESVGLLSGSASSTRVVQEAIASGEIDLAVGTHALIQEAVSFSRLGLVIIDEQHRFGVVQRSAIEEKGKDVDLLVMSATPIP